MHLRIFKICGKEYIRVIFLDIKFCSLKTLVLCQTSFVVKTVHLNWCTSQWLTEEPYFFLMHVKAGRGNYFIL